MGIVRLGTIATAALGLALFAQEDAEFISQMKMLNDMCGAVRKMEPKTGAEAVKRAERMGSAYESMIQFWRQRSVNDAVKWSEEGKSAALQLASAAAKNDAEKAASAFSALTGTCKSCHDVHREKTPDGKYRIK